MAWTYTSKTKVSDLSGIAESDLKDAWSSWVEYLIDQHTGESYLTTTTYTNEPHDGDGTNILFVDHPPIVSVSSLQISDAEYGGSDYEVYREFVKLVSNSQTEVSNALYAETEFPEGQQNITITYIGGASSVPANIEFAATQMIAQIGLVSKREGSDASLKYSRVTQTQGDSSTTTEQFGLQSVLKGIMKAYIGQGLKSK